MKYLFVELWQPLVLTTALIAVTTARICRRAEHVVRLGWRWMPAIATLSALLGTLLTGPLSWLGRALFVLVVTASVGLRLRGGRRAVPAVLAAGPLAAVLAAPLVPVSPVAGLILAPTVLAALAGTAGLMVYLVNRLRPPNPPPSPARPPIDPMEVAIGAVFRGLAVGAAFLVADVWFPEHPTWPPLTALVVGTAGSTWTEVGRRGVLRLAGATGGATVASLVLLVGPPRPAAATLAIAALLAGALLRSANYAWWAGGMTAGLVLLTEGRPDLPFAISRLLAIASGGLLAVAAVLAPLCLTLFRRPRTGRTNVLRTLERHLYPRPARTAGAHRAQTPSERPPGQKDGAHLGGPASPRSGTRSLAPPLAAGPADPYAAACRRHVKTDHGVAAEF